MFKVGLATTRLNPLGGIETMVRLLTGPKMAYKRFPTYASLFDRVFKFQTKSAGKNKAIVTMRMEGQDYSPSKDSCYYTQGILAAIPTVWNLPPAEIREIKCMCKPDADNIKDGVQYEADICEYEVQWQPLISRYQRIRENLLGWISPQTKDVKLLEESYRQVDQKNAELIARNKQLAAVREIALGVDGVRTIDEALSLAVEQSRNIDGVRFVLVQKLDESKEYVITPYYSRIRPQSRYIVNAINALGFNIEKELGNDPTSSRLRFKFSKLKVAQDYLMNPRIMVTSSLADLLDGVWPRALCQAIQKLLGVKKLVIVPIIVEGESWGNMLFFLTQDVPIDILEMIGAHCATAVKNIGYTEAQANEALLRRILIEHSRDGISILDQNGKSYEANQRFADMLGYSLEEVKKLHVFDWETRYSREQVLKTFQKLDEKGYIFETRHRRKDGTIYDVEISTNAAVFAGQKYMFCVCRDITERKQAEKAIKESEEFSTSILENSPNPVMVINPDSSIKYVNPAFEKLSGFTASQIIGMTTPYPWWPEETREEINAAQKDAILKGGLRRSERFFQKKNGELFWVALNAAPIMNEGKIKYLLINWLDITEGKKIEAALRKSEERFRQIFQQGPLGINLSDLGHHFTIMNAQFCKMLGYTEQELRSMTFEDISFPEDIQLDEMNLQKVAKGKLAYYRRETRCIKKTKDVIWVNLTVTLLRDNSGEPLGFLAMIEDITQQKTVEEALEYQRKLIDQIIATIPNAVLVINEETRVLLANDTFYQTFNLKKTEVENKPISESIHVAELDQALKKIVYTRQKNANISFEFRYPVNNITRLLATGIVKMQNKRYLIFINDITEEREKQERLYLTDRLASVGEMASGVAHELNNPLTSVIGLSSLLMKQKMPSEMHEDLAAIHTEAQRCAAIVKNLLTFARKHTPKREPLQVTKVLDDVLKLRAYELRAQNIAVETRFATDLPDVLADYFQIQQVFLNIILNAEAAMVGTNRGGKLKITGERDNNYVKISFADNGPGIPPENMKLIFNPFFTTKEVGKGTGLGLSICYGIIASHGGKIYAKSQPANGATFVVELPSHNN
jgi:PAS domain S-box-containing protein